MISLSRFKLAQVLFWNRKYDTSLELYTDLLAKPADSIDIPGVDNISLRREMTEVLLGAGRYADYLKESRALVEADPGNIGLRLQRLRAAVAIEQFETAITECSEILKIEPEHREALAKKFPDEPEIMKLLGQAYLWDRKYAQVLVHFRKLQPQVLTDTEVAQGYAEASAGLKAATPDDAKMVKALDAASTCPDSADAERFSSRPQP